VTPARRRSVRRATPVTPLVVLPADIPLGLARTVRIISAAFDEVRFFESLTPNTDQTQLRDLLNLTSPATLAAIGSVEHVAPEDRAVGTGAGWAMTAFVHPARPSRFTDGSFGVWYAADSLETAIAETMHHQAVRLRETNEPAQQVALQVLQADLTGMVLPCSELPTDLHRAVHDPFSYQVSQQVGAAARSRGSDGVRYGSVRHPAGECTAVFRPRMVRNAHRLHGLEYAWDGARFVPDGIVRTA
jgi:hypothetical protein